MDVQEPTVLEYARFHHLASDHRAVHPLRSNGMPLLSENFVSDLVDPEGLPSFPLPSPSFENERLSFGKGDALLLRSLIAEPVLPPLDEIISVDHRRTRNLKLEPPILRTDHDLDVRAYGQKTVPDFRALYLPCENVDEESDQGLSWPTSAYDLPNKLISGERNEKLRCSTEDLLYLSSMIKDAGPNLCDLEQYLNYKKAAEPATPPLLPLSPAMTPFVPSSPVGHLELLSDLPSTTDQEIREIDEKLMAQDRIEPLPRFKIGSPISDATLLDDDELGRIYSPLCGIGKEPLLSPPSRRLRPEDRKVEGPLTPPINVAHSAPRTDKVSFPEMLQQIIPELPPPIEKKPDELSSQADFSALFVNVVAPIAEKVNSAIEQEQLQEEDSTMRVVIPVMDFSLPTPPWKIYSKANFKQESERLNEQKAQARLLSEIKQRHLKAHLWPGASRVERELPWTPFPLDLGRVALDEAIKDDDAVAAFMTDLHLGDIIDSGSLTWKPEGLRILRDGDDDDLEVEEIQPGVFKEDKDMVSMVKKRKLELQDGSLDTSYQKEIAKKVPKAKIVKTSLLGGAFSAFEQLSNYVDLRSGLSENDKLTRSLHFDSQPPETQFKLNVPSMDRSIEPVVEGPPELVLEPTKPLPIPSCISATEPRPFVVSSSVLTQKTLIRRIQTLYPCAELIERDWKAHAPILPARTSQSLHSPSPNLVDEEADLLLSPSTGLILTTLQKIKQRPLPGQVQRSAIQERLSRVVPRYERLVVLVSEGRPTGSSGPSVLMGDDCETLVELVGFAASLTDEVEVKYVAGGEDELADWIVGCMVRYGVKEAETKLLQDETLWELFLRRAGMNAFAAQLVLSELKAPEKGQDEEEAQETQNRKVNFGLTKFVKMKRSERLETFERLLGVRKVLLSVSRNLDAKWQ